MLVVFKKIGDVSNVWCDIFAQSTQCNHRNTTGVSISTKGVGILLVVFDEAQDVFNVGRSIFAQVAQYLCRIGTGIVILLVVFEKISNFVNRVLLD